MENDNCGGSCTCVQGIGRREFLKIAAAAGLLVGCSPTQQAVAPTAEPSTVPTPVPTIPPTPVPTIPPTPVPTPIPVEEKVMDVYIAYCGYDGCPACPKYEKTCDGCLTNDGQLASYAINCTVRNCNVKRSVANCATCEEYVCGKLNNLFSEWKGSGYTQIAEQAQATLEEIHQSLSP